MKNTHRIFVEREISEDEDHEYDYSARIVDLIDCGPGFGTMAIHEKTLVHCSHDEDRTISKAKACAKKTGYTMIVVWQKKETASN